jgi:hypothetical protein
MLRISVSSENSIFLVGSEPSWYSGGLKVNISKKVLKNALKIKKKLMKSGNFYAKTVFNKFDFFIWLQLKKRITVNT